MRGVLVVLIAVSCSATKAEDRQVATLKRRAQEALSVPDWPAARLALEEAALLAPDDPEVMLQLADTLLTAYDDPQGARRIYWRLRETSRARALHGLGRCALWEGDGDRAIELFEASLAEYPTAACARDLAVRLLGRGENADEALDAVEKISGNTLRSRLLLAAAGRAPRPDRLPEGWSYGLERARLAPLEEAKKEVEAYVAAAGFSPTARERMMDVLEGDFALQRNPAAARAVKD